MIHNALAVCCLALPVVAEPIGQYECGGVFPDWSLTLGGESGVMTVDGVQRGVGVPQVSVAEGRDTPVAATLIDDDAYATGIILIDHAECMSDDQIYPLRGHLLTQRGNQPILLTGCCSLGR